MIVQCELCPKGCVIKPGQSGECRIRVNVDGRLTAVTYGYPCAVHVDPVEKKPVYHFMPGTTTFSVATVGCNLHCKNCQNWEISQGNPEDLEAAWLPPESIPGQARKYGCRSVSYTYTEPLVYYEYTLDACRRAREAGLRNILVTAGYLNEAPLRELFKVADSVRIDLKSMSDAFYRDVCDASLAPVLRSLEVAKEMGLELEVIHLVIPTLNDRDEDLESVCRWIKENLGRETPLHFSRFFPQYRLVHLPPTPIPTLDRAREIARETGLDFIYIGNILDESASTTYCPGCREPLVRRRGYDVVENKLRDGACPVCGREIYGVWK